jgi:hypothetical protein
MKKIFTLLFITFNLTVFAQYGCQWGEMLNGVGMERSWDVHLTQNDKVLVCGDFTDELVIGDQTWLSTGSYDSFVAQFDKFGNFEWLYQLTGVGTAPIMAVEADQEGNVIFSGYYEDSLMFMGEEYYSESWTLMVAKLDSDGQPQWMYNTRSEGGDIAHGVAMGEDGQVTFIGWYQNDIIVSDEILFPCYGSSDIIIGRLDSDGNVLWADHMGAESIDYGYSVEMDSQGNAYFCGTASPNSTFGNLTLETAGSFVSKYNNEGNCEYVTSASGVGTYGLEVDSQGRVALSTYVYGGETAVLGEFILENQEEDEDMVLARMDAEGNWIDVMMLQGSGMDKMRKIAFDTQDEPYFIGAFNGDLTLGDDLIETNGMDDVLIIKLNSEWEIESYTQIGGEKSEKAYGIDVDEEGDIYATLWTMGEFSLGGYSVNTGGDQNFGSVLVRLNESISVSDIKAGSTISVYPNPVVDFLYISSENSNEFECVIFDESGRIVLQRMIYSDQQIDLSRLSNGCYFVKVSEGNTEENFMFIKK